MIERLLAGEAALARDELDAAGRLFSQVSVADPRNAIALVGLARIAVRQGELGEARALAVRALEIDPDEAAAARLLVELDPVAEPVPERVLEAPRAPARSHRPAKAGWRALLDLIDEVGVLGTGAARRHCRDRRTTPRCRHG